MTINSAKPSDADVYRHKKRGTLYIVVGTAELQMSQDILCDGAELTVYRGEDGKLWARHIDEFHDGRFEQVAALSTPQPTEGA